MHLRAKLEEIVASCPGQLGLAVRNLATGETVGIDADQWFPTASVFKVPLLVELYRRVDAGEIDLLERVALTESMKTPGSGVLKEMGEGASLTLKDLATLMIILSDNTATDILMERLDGSRSVQRTMQALGMEGVSVVFDCKALLLSASGLDMTDRSRANLDEAARRLRHEAYNFETTAFAPDPSINNMATPNGLMRLYEAIERRQIVSPDACDAMLDILERQQLRERIPLYLPRQIRIAHKTGTIGWTRNDSGIIRVPGAGPVVLVALTQRVPLGQARDADAAIAAAAKAVYTHFEA